VQIRTVLWNIFHGRDAPPDASLFTLRSKLLRITERNDTHVQVNRDLFDRFAALISAAEWDLLLLQECPPRWAEPFAAISHAQAQRVLTSRNWLPAVQGAIHRFNPDLAGSWEGGSNTTLVRGPAIAERRELVIRLGHPERRAMAFTRLDDGVCVANLHASNDNYALAEEEIRLAADTATEWARDAPLIFGGDFNVRPQSSDLFAELERRLDLRAPTAPDAIDHLLVRGLEVDEPPRPWPADVRETPWDGLTLRLSDHAPVEALFDARRWRATRENHPG
jgi:endonuclease/exonuclease/phosphatase family metal-dependent hydrolase